MYTGFLSKNCDSVSGPTIEDGVEYTITMYTVTYNGSIMNTVITNELMEVSTRNIHTNKTATKEYLCLHPPIFGYDVTDIYEIEETINAAINEVK